MIIKATTTPLMHPTKTIKCQKNNAAFGISDAIQRNSNTQVEELRSQQSLLPPAFQLPCKSPGFSQRPASTLNSPMNRKIPSAVKRSARPFCEKAGGIPSAPEQKAYPIWKCPPAHSAHKLIRVIFFPVLVQDTFDCIKLERQQCL